MTDFPPVILVRGKVLHVPGAIVICHNPYTITGAGRFVPFRYKRPSNVFHIAEALIARRGLPLHYDEIIEHIYADDIFAEPDFAKDAVQVNVHKLRRTLPIIGITIQTRRGWGFQAAALPQQARAAA